MSENERIEATAGDVAIGLVEFCCIPEGFPSSEDMEFFSVDVRTVLQELLFLELFAVHMSIQLSPWTDEDKELVGWALPTTIGAYLRPRIPKFVMEGFNLGDFLVLMEQRVEQYWDASQESHPSGPGWQITRKFAEFCNEGDWESAVPGAFSAVLVYTSMLEKMLTINRKVVFGYSGGPLEKFSATVKEVAMGLVQSCTMPGGFPEASEIEIFSEGRGVVLRELLFVKIFAAHMSIELSPWTEPQKSQVREALPKFLASLLPLEVEGLILEGVKFEEFLKTSNQRVMQYWSAGQECFESGSSWQMSKLFAEFCNHGDWESALSGASPVEKVFLVLLNNMVEINSLVVFVKRG